MYLYRAVDKQGKTVESYLSRTRDITAAKAFFRKALKRHGEPRIITLDGFEPTHAALRRMGMNNEFNYRSRRSRPDSKLSLLEQRRPNKITGG
jgi:putative transposase